MDDRCAEGNPRLVHKARYAFSGAEYDRLVDLGFFGEGRVELVDGEIVQINPQRDSHIVAVRRLNRLFVPAVSEGWIVQGQLPVALGESRPEPDISVVRDDDARAIGARFIVEVAERSLEYDTTTNLGLYARHGVPDYWVVDLVHREILMCSEPTPDGRYRFMRRVGAGEIARSPHAPLPGRDGRSSSEIEKSLLASDAQGHGAPAGSEVGSRSPRPARMRERHRPGPPAL